MSVRAALDAARAVFAVSRGEPAAELSLPPADATGSANDLSTTHARAVAMWSAAEEVLRALLETPTLSGQALVGEARKRHWLDLSDAHALVALQGAADRAQELSGSGLPRNTRSRTTPGAHSSRPRNVRCHHRSPRPLPMGLHGFRRVWRPRTFRPRILHPRGLQPRTRQPRSRHARGLVWCWSWRLSW